ncbi:hypothetical protein, partial [Paraburkholderia caledonica]|uniref:hypothetical protein n=1 Tax=Paraburkholderia caledonica TaxID=134536 RepID=UPI001C4EE63B
MEIFDGPLRAALPAVPTLMRRCLELPGDDFTLKLRQQLFALRQAEPQVASSLTSGRVICPSGTLVISPSPLSTARISSNFMRNLRHSTGRDYPAPLQNAPLLRPARATPPNGTLSDAYASEC